MVKNMNSSTNVFDTVFATLYTWTIYLKLCATVLAFLKWT